MSGKWSERKPSALSATFTYYEGSEIMGNEGVFVLGLASAIERLDAACRCRTWGEFARLSGYTWKALVEERREELAKILGSGRPRASEPFNFAAIWGGDDLVTGLIPDPRQCACDVLAENVPLEILHHPRLKGLLEWEVGAPGGGIDAVSSVSSKGFEVLAQVLHGAGFTGLTFTPGPRPSIFEPKRA